ncbi:MAG: hypothetical protein ACW9XA_05665 [Candidatus Nitrosopumilus sp. bin_6a]
MTSKFILTGIVILSFIAGSTMTGIMADASEKPNGQPFQALWDAIGLLDDRILGLEDKRFSEFTGSVLVIDNRASNVLTVECNSDYPYYQYDSKFIRPTSSIPLVEISNDVDWDGDKMVSNTNYVAYGRDMGVSKSIICSNLP